MVTKIFLWFSALISQALCVFLKPLTENTSSKVIESNNWAKQWLALETDLTSISTHQTKEKPTSRGSNVLKLPSTPNLRKWPMVPSFVKSELSPSTTKWLWSAMVLKILKSLQVPSLITSSISRTMVKSKVPKEWQRASENKNNVYKKSLPPLKRLVQLHLDLPFWRVLLWLLKANLDQQSWFALMGSPISAWAPSTKLNVGMIW